MAIDDSGEWWVGSEPVDIEEFLAAFTRQENGYPSVHYRLVGCACSSNRFKLERAADVTRRTCAACGASRIICGESEAWEEAEEDEGAEPFACVECECVEANILVGFAVYEEQPHIDGVKWHYVGVRCAECGILGCFNDGKVGWGPASEVFDTV